MKLNKIIKIGLLFLLEVGLTLIFKEVYRLPLEVSAFIVVFSTAMLTTALRGYRYHNDREEIRFLKWLFVYMPIAFSAYVFSIYEAAVVITLLFMFIESGVLKKIRLYYLSVKASNIEKEISRRERSKVIYEKKYERAKNKAVHEEAQQALADFDSRRELYVYKDV